MFFIMMESQIKFFINLKKSKPNLKKIQNFDKKKKIALLIDNT